MLFRSDPALDVTAHGPGWRVRTATSTLDADAVVVATAGPEDGPAIILLHGFPESHRTWRKLVPLLSDRYRLIMPDQRGFAGSDAPPDKTNYATDKLVADLKRRDAGAYRLDHARTLGADAGWQRRHRMLAAADQHVAEVECHGGVADADLAGAGRRQVDLLEAHHLGAAGLMNANGFAHENLPARCVAHQ